MDHAADHPVISEFLAVNESGLEDEDGDHSPWIELFNPHAETVQLDGYSLTNEKDELRKWPLPQHALAPREAIVLFASGKDRRNQATIWHTSFTLPEKSGFLALVDPSGGLADQFEGDDYPEQEADVSFGSEITTSKSLTTLVNSGASCKVHVPRADLGQTWLQPAFDDSHWTSAQTGIGVERGRGYEALFGRNGNLSRQMYGLNASVYVRIPFHVDGCAIERERDPPAHEV